MDAKITKKRLNIFLSYDWIKIILTAVAAIVLWSLIFTTTATRVTQAQNFTIFNYTGTKVTSRFSSYSDLLREKNVFSYDILEISSTDITTSEQYSETILQTRISTNEGDALFAANVNEDVTTKYQDDQGNEFTPTYLEQFLHNYYYTAATFGEGGYLDQMAEYLNGYYHGDYTSNAIDEEKAEADFRARIKRLNDKRFKKESQIREGLVQEIERIESYKKALTSFLSYLEKGYVSLQETTLYMQDSNGNSVVKTDYYSINLCPDERMENLKKDVCYYKTITDEEGEKKVSTAENICLVLLDIAEEKYSYSRFEGLSFVNYLIETHCSELNA